MMYASLRRTEINVPGAVITLRWNVITASAQHYDSSCERDGGKYCSSVRLSEDAAEKIPHLVEKKKKGLFFAPSPPRCTCSSAGWTAEKAGAGPSVDTVD